MFALIVILGLVASSTALPSRKHATDAHGVQSVAETYPEDNELKVVVIIGGRLSATFLGATAPADDEATFVTGADASAAVEIENTAAKAYREYNFGAIENPADVDAPAVDFVAPVSNTPISATRFRRSIPDNSNKNQSAKLAAAADEEKGSNVPIEDAEKEAEEIYVAPPPATVVPAHRLTRKARKSTKATRNAGTKLTEDEPKVEVVGGTFFPIEFGGTMDDAIAVSTGSGNGTTSRAIAYGPTIGVHPAPQLS